jgi:hypothetical protein
MKSTDFLYAVPSFKSGVARILDFGGTLNVYNSSETEEDADYKAMYSDWYMVGKDLSEAMSEYDRIRQREEREYCKA